VEKIQKKKRQKMNESTNVFLGFVSFDNIDYEGKGRDSAV